MSITFPAELAAHLSGSVRMARRRYRKRLARCQKKFSQKAVHDLRIETRRLLALLDLLEALRFPESLKKVRKTFKRRLDAFDDMRDTHVQRVLLKPFWPDFPEAREFKRHLARCEKRLVSKLSKEIKLTKSGRLNRQLKTVEKCLRRCDETPGASQSAASARAVLGDAFKRVIALRRKILRNRPSTIHLTRVAFKRFRYTAELLQPFLPEFTRERLARMKDFQGSAGNIQDLAVLLGRIDKEIKDGYLDARCLKNLRAELLRRERSAIDSFMAKIRELSDFEPDHSVSFAPEPETSST